VLLAAAVLLAGGSSRAMLASARSLGFDIGNAQPICFYVCLVTETFNV